MEENETLLSLLLEGQQRSATLEQIRLEVGNLLAKFAKERADMEKLYGEKVTECQIQTSVAKRASAQLLIVVRCLRNLHMHLSNQPVTSLSYFGGEEFAKSVRAVGEVLLLCQGIE